MKKSSVISATALATLASFSLRCSSSSDTPATGGSSSGSSSSSPASGSSSGGNGGSSGTGDDSGTDPGGSSGGASSGTNPGGDSGTTGSSSGPPVVLGDGGTGGAQSVLQRGNDIYRRSTYVEPGLDATAAKTMAPDTTFDTNATFPGNGNLENQGSASVLYLENGPAAGAAPGAAMCSATGRPAGNGLFFAFPALGSNPNVVAFDETTGQTVWTAHVTSGGDGIRGTPVIEPMSRRLYVVTGNNPHLVHALSVDNGAEIMTGGWPVTLSSSTVKYGKVAFDSGAENQHGATLLLNGILYVPFGGPYGDGGSYLGWIVAVDVTNPTHVGGWATQSPRSGIWGSGGLASDGTYVFGVTGDTTSVPRAMSDSEEVVRVSGLAQFTRDAASVFVPAEWTGWDKPTGDLDFGASTPAYVPLPSGSNPAGILVAPAKAGRVYVLNGTNLSGGTYPSTGGQLGNVVVAKTNAESVYTSPTIYSTTSGLHAAINVGDTPVCPTGSPSSTEMIVSTLITPGKTPVIQTEWCAANAGGGHTNYPPISTTTDGAAANPLVWFVNGSQLSAVDGETGKAVVTTTGAKCSMVPSMSFPIAVKNRIVVSALGHLCSWSPGGK